jgi:hypothetical protein
MLKRGQVFLQFTSCLSCTASCAREHFLLNLLNPLSSHLEEAVSLLDISLGVRFKRGFLMVGNESREGGLGVSGEEINLQTAVDLTRVMFGLRTVIGETYVYLRLDHTLAQLGFVGRSNGLLRTILFLPFFLLLTNNYNCLQRVVLPPLKVVALSFSS